MWYRWCMLLLINMTLKKINILEYAFGEGGGGHQKAYAVYAFINVDNCERPLIRTSYFTQHKNAPTEDQRCWNEYVSLKSSFNSHKTTT